MFHISLLLAFGYVVWRFVMPLPWSVARRVMLACALLLLSKYHLIQQWVFGTMFSPELPRFLVLLLGGLFCAFVLLLVMIVILDVLLVVRWAITGRRGIDSIAGTRMRYAVACAALLLSAVGVDHATRVPEVRRVELRMRDLPPGLDGFRVVQLSDLHISRLFQAPWVRQVVERTNNLKPDLVVITGDLIDGTLQDRRHDVQPLGGLQARHGVIASMGNHEYYFGAAEWTAEFERLGMRVLANQNAAIEDRGGRLVVAAINDPAASTFGLDGPDLERALAGVPADQPVILLNHRPTDTARHADAGVDVQLSGHTHGGMVRGLDLVVRTANGGFVSGQYTIGAMQLYVSNGTGLWNGFPIRLGVPGEITEFVLKPAPDPHGSGEEQMDAPRDM